MFYVYYWLLLLLFCRDCSSLIWSNKWFAHNKNNKQTNIYKYIYIFQMSQEINIFISWFAFVAYLESLENMRRKVTRENWSKNIKKNQRNNFFLYLFPFNMTYCGVIWQFQSWNLLFHPDCCELRAFFFFQVSIIKLWSRIRAYSSSCFVFQFFPTTIQTTTTTTKTSLCFNYNSNGKEIFMLWQFIWLQ